MQGRGPEPRKCMWPLEARKSKGVDTPPEPRKGTSPAFTLTKAQRDLYQTSKLQNYKIINVYCLS